MPPKLVAALSRSRLELEDMEELSILFATRVLMSPSLAAAFSKWGLELEEMTELSILFTTRVIMSSKLAAAFSKSRLELEDMMKHYRRKRCQVPGAGCQVLGLREEL